MKQKAELGGRPCDRPTQGRLRCHGLGVREVAIFDQPIPRE